VDLDVTAVRGITSDVRKSALAVNDSAQRLLQAGKEFDPSAAGADYRSQGARIEQAMHTAVSHVFGWANCTNDLASLLSKAVSANVGIDQSTAAGINSVRETFV
jgi:hypothetical protein